MKQKRRLGLATLLLATVALGAPAVAKGEDVRWRIKGDLSEACTCTVPCTCNFGQGPSPHHFCWALFSYGIERGRYGEVKLDGLKLAGAAAEKGFVIYIDARATPAQADALKAIGMRIIRSLPSVGGNPAEPAMKLLGIKTVPIEQVVGEKRCLLKIGDVGGFEADYLIGIDGKTPITVENNWSWNVTNCIKAKARRLQYKDEFGNTIDVEGVNSNQGKFDYTEKTTIFFR